ncbi:hypothetical protein PCANC_26100 [Puccinia coronata f. sp. avenae]|uniref:Uncharacterized protein n=1 Tax=Puccinia coronata f. sp. avenae TaxID=200324 RepID=A0A2N5RYR9_9BASI|nr:hypothetical protein PCANC_26100 [Puccinia coronata f. sp. avenae]
MPSKQPRNIFAKEKFDKLGGDARHVREQNLAQSSSQSAPAPSADAATLAPNDDGVLPMPVDVTGIAESLALVNTLADEPIPPTSQPSGNEDAEMHNGTDLGNQTNEEESTSQSIPVPAAALPENTAMQDDPAEPGQPASTTESGVPQPESSTSQAPLSSESTDAAPAAVPSQRVTIMINRAEVDIINTGIDPTFLEALPDGMRKEFLNQHLRATASARRIICPGSVEYKYRCCCRKDQARNTTAAGGTRASADAEIDPATFLAGLELMHLSPLSHPIFLRRLMPQRLCPSPTAYPSPKVLVNLCENSRSRTELISTLLGHLQDGTRDAATIDHSFLQVSSPANLGLAPVTPKSTAKLRREIHVGPLPHLALHKHPPRRVKVKRKAKPLLPIQLPLTPLAKRLEDNKNQPAGASMSVAACAPLNEAVAAPAASKMGTDWGATQATATSEARPSQSATDKLDAFPPTLEKAPALAANDIRMIVNLLDTDECSSKTFTHTVTFI